MEALKLYYSPGACSMAAHIALEEIGAPYEAERVVIAEGGNRRPEYLTINPHGRVPALRIRDGGHRQVLTELMAILLFLARRHPEAKLIPDDSDGFMRAVEWLSWLATTVHQTGVRMMLKPARFATGASCEAQVAESGRSIVEPAFVEINARLRDHAWALGEYFTAVDAFLLVFFRWGGNRLHLPMRGPYPEYTRVMDKVRARPAVARVIADEGVQIE
ncbi:MAG TPA: glutathione S-transferase N-terminal domain-containing protein [Nevskiaceae bacterium]|nr:glutathione S-transferase N-terminal domain-containing protein [Nevskiaceae bacterium]